MPTDPDQARHAQDILEEVTKFDEQLTAWLSATSLPAAFSVTGWSDEARRIVRRYLMDTGYSVEEQTSPEDWLITRS